MRNPFTKLFSTVKNMFNKEHNTAPRIPSIQPRQANNYGKANSDLNKQRNLFLRALSGLKIEKKAIKKRKRSLVSKHHFGNFSPVKPFNYRKAA